MQTVQGGTRPILRALLDPAARHGAYFGPWLLGLVRLPTAASLPSLLRQLTDLCAQWGVPGEDKIAAHCSDAAAAAALWTWTEDVVGLDVLPASAEDAPLVAKR